MAAGLLHRAAAASALLSSAVVYSLNNGLGRVPQMGYNSWYDVMMTPSDASLRATAQALKSSGLQALGYTYINIDDGWAAGRDAQGNLYPDPKAFPQGLKALADYLHSEGFLFGVYTDRGTNTCGGRPGALGHEYQDAAWYASQGVDYLKEDSCNASQDPETAYLEYATMRDALNATGRPIFFSLCGWENWYSPVLAALGNSARIGPDDTNWGGVLSDIDDMAPLWPNAGPGSFNDPCLLLGRDMNGNVAVTDQQGRFQFSMWALLMAPMLLSSNVRNLTAFQLETYSNEEIIGVGQDIKGRQGQRLIGGAMSLSRAYKDGNIPVTLQTCASGVDGTTVTPQQWQWNVSAPMYVSNPSTSTCMNQDDCGSDVIVFDCVTSGGTCTGPNSYTNLQYYLAGDGTMRSAMNNQCITAAGTGNQVNVMPCTGLANQQFAYDPTAQTIKNGDLCLTAGGAPGSRASIWGRPLSDGSWAVGFFNADITPVNLTCAADCMEAFGWQPNQVLAVRDLWAHEDLGFTNATVGWSVTSLPPDGGVEVFRFSPYWNTTQTAVSGKGKATTIKRTRKL